VFRHVVARLITSRSNTAMFKFTPAVLPQGSSPSPRYYRMYRPHYRGYRCIPVVPITVQLSISKWPILKARPQFTNGVL
jgi:hypothetical protein